MKAVKAQLGSRFQVVIPKIIREALRLEPGTTLLFLVEGDRIIVRPQPEDYVETLRGLHKELWSDPDKWLEEERSSWA